MPASPPFLPRAAALALALGLAGPAAGQDAALGFGQGGFDSGAPVDVSADELAVDQGTGRAVLTGNVVIAQGDMRLTAARVTVDYATVDGRRRIERLLAEGEVLVVSGEDAAAGDEAVYTLATSGIVLTGDVVVTQDGNTLAGDSLAIDLSTGAGTVTGRVRTTLQP